MYEADEATDGYLRERYWQEDDLLRALREDLEQRGPAIQVSPETGRLLALTVRVAGAARVLEVGTLFGYSGVWMARELPDEGHLDTLELSEVHADAAEAWFARAGLADRVTVHRGAALDTLASLEGPYDVVFLDAAKAEYVAYAEHAARLLRMGGTMLADNVIWSGRVGDPAVTDDDTEGIRRFHELIAGDPRWESTVVPVGDGVSVSVRGG
jgi:caffeoyl-CoA O-methyltransferase